MGNVSAPESHIIKTKTQTNTTLLTFNPSGVHFKVAILIVCVLNENTTEK